MDRRRFLAGTAATAAVVVVLPVAPAAATPDAMAEAIKKVVGTATPTEGRVKLDVPPLVENGSTVPLTVSVDSPMTRRRPRQGDPRLQREEPAAQRLLRAPRPAQRQGRHRHAHQAGRQPADHRHRRDQRRQVLERRRRRDRDPGRLPRGVDLMSNILVNAPKTAKRGDVIEIKALILHPMETGFRPGPNGRIIPRNIIEHFTATWNGAEIFAMDMSPAIAANPFVSFFAAGERERHGRPALDRRRGLRRRGAGRHRRRMSAAASRLAWRWCSPRPMRRRRLARTSDAPATRTWARPCRRCRTTTRQSRHAVRPARRPALGEGASAPPTNPAPTVMAPRPASMKGVATRYPAIPQGSDRPVDLEGRINLCRTENQKADRLPPENRDLLALTAYVAHQSRGLPIAPPDDPRLDACPRAGRGDLSPPPGPAQPLLRDLPRRQCRQEAGGCRRSPRRIRPAIRSIAWNGRRWAR